MEMESWCENCSPRFTVICEGGSTVSRCGWAQEKTARDESAAISLLLLIEKCLDFIEIFILARQSYMRRKCQSAFAINNEGGRQRIDTAVQLTDGIVAQ